MTATVDAQPTTSPTFAVVPVRRRDVRRLRRYGPPPVLELPARHGGAGDPRYPSRYKFRYRLGVMVDVVLHSFWVLFAIGMLLEYVTHSDLVAFFGGAVIYAALSFVHRVLLQRVWHTTLGKSVTGIRLIRDDTGGPPTLRSLGREWRTAFFRVLGAVFDSVLTGF